MRNILLPAALAAMMAFAPVASAAPGTSASHPAATQQAARFAKVRGVVRSVDAKAHAFTLEDGRTFALPAGFADPGLKAGKKVTVDWAWTKDARLVKEVTLDN